MQPKHLTRFAAGMGSTFAHLPPAEIARLRAQTQDRITNRGAQKQAAPPRSQQQTVGDALQSLAKREELRRIRSVATRSVSDAMLALEARNKKNGVGAPRRVVAVFFPR